jgi:hypothetical protein
MYIYRMRKALILAALLAMLPAPALAWGAHAHRYIMSRAIDVLPSPIKPFFEHFRSELVVRAIDPDTWRAAGWEDDPSHFLDFGVPEYGPRPFVELPREYGAAIEKFGMATLRKYGVMPWRLGEEFGNLRRAFEALGRNASYAPGDVVLFTAVASHYIQDGHQPLHATNNWDGQLTGQHGIHARFETTAFDRFESRLSIVPPPVKPLRNPRDAAFEILLASYDLVPGVLEADRAAVAGKNEYDDEYYEKFFARVKPVLERRVAESIAASASLIVGAWEAAGKPTLKTDIPASVQKVRSPKPF